MTPLHQPERYPLSARYDPSWLLELAMGPNPLWLLEDLASELSLKPGMRVLDLGSGRGATSVFLASEFGVQVVAADLWVDPTEAAATFVKAGVDDRVLAIRTEAHALPFARGTFDAIVCIDAYEYFGTSDSYLPYIVKFLKPGGRLGVATPALRREVRDLGEIPPHIKACVGWEAMAWHTADWWRSQWEITELVDVTSARLQEQGWADWLRWARAEESDDQESVLRMLETDGGDLLTFALVTAVKRSPPSCSNPDEP
jgi:SAM-dependent methyltransferase